jgi:hypothetical protein
MSNIKKIALLVGSAVCVLQGVAHATQRWDVIPTSGHPLDNEPRSNFVLFDQKVTNNSSTARVWITNFQRPNCTSLNGCAGSVQAFYNQIGVNQGLGSRLCRFDSTGNWTGCTSWLVTSPSNVLSLAAQETVHLQTNLKNGGTHYAAMFWYTG